MNRQMLRSLVLVLAVSLGVGQSASAQFGFGRSTNSLVSLARNEAVQKDLGVPSDVGGKLSALYDEYRNASDREFKAQGFDNDAIRDLPALERAAEMRKVNEASTDVNRKLLARFLPKVEELLTSEQLGRLKQIQLQAAGVEVWLEPLLAKELDLSEAQMTQLGELRKEYSRRQTQLDGDPQQRYARIRELNAERDKQALTVLSDAQKAKLEELKGKPFDVSQLGFRRRNN